MSGSWAFTLGKTGIVTVRFECELTEPVLDVNEAMGRLAAAAVLEASTPRFGGRKTHEEPL